MERNVPIDSKFLKKQESSDLKHLFHKQMFGLAAALFLTGCSGNTLEEPYSFADRGSNLGVSEGSASLAPLFASDLCVIDGEPADDSTEFTGEAGAVFGITDQHVIYSKNAYKQLYPPALPR